MQSCFGEHGPLTIVVINVSYCYRLSSVRFTTCLVSPPHFMSKEPTFCQML